MDETVTNDQLKALAATNGVRGVRIVGMQDSFIVVIQTSAGDKTLFHSEGKKPREYKRIETILDYLRTDMGLGRATIEFDSWTPKQRQLKPVKA